MQFPIHEGINRTKEARQMGLLWFLFIGLVAGWLTGLIMRGGGYGIFGDLILGVIGAFVGRWLFGVLGVGASYGFIGSVICATVGAILLVVLLRLVRRV
jgi:uncharacterized membrane protein YeaQ/YmgE (transglycosylase-associated protein family)